MEQHELLTVIDELEDERSRLRRREGIWVSVLAHIVIFLVIAFLPRFLPQVRVVNPSDDIRQHQRDITQLSLPPDVLKTLRSAPSPRVKAPAPQPAPQPQAIQAPPPPRQVAPPPQQQQPPFKPPVQQPVQQPKPAPQQQAQTAPQLAPAPPVDAPKLPLPKPSFQVGTSTAGETVREAARQAARAGTQSSDGDGNLGAPGRGQPSGLAGGAQVLTDTGGWDPNPYVRRVVYDTEQAWYPIIPEEVRAPLLKKGVVGIRFKIGRDGSVMRGSMVLESPSHDPALDRAAWSAITSASPYPPLPAEFKGSNLELRFGFYYNLQPGLK